MHGKPTIRSIRKDSTKRIAVGYDYLDLRSDGIFPLLDNMKHSDNVLVDVGTEAFYPMLDSYVELYVLLNEGAYGSIKKEDFIRLVTEVGASEAKTVTPAGVFKVLKS